MAMNEEKYILLIDCPDEKGLVHKITGVLYRNDFNVLGNQEFVDANNGQFFMRTEFTGQPNRSLLQQELLEILPEGATVRLSDTYKRNLLVMATKEHHCLADLITRSVFGELNARIVAVVANHDVLRPLVEKFDIPFHVVSHEGLNREDHEKALLKVLGGYTPDFIVLARYMRVLSSDLTARYANRLINIHHSLLPAFIGASPYRQAFERGVKFIGATSHFVTDTLDEGPIIAQGVIPVSHADTPASMAQAGRDVEKVVLAKALKLVLEDRVFLNGNKTIVFE